MSTQPLTRYLCDSPHCTANHITDGLPDQWTALKSNAHIPPTPANPFPSNRRRRRTLTYTQRSLGSFQLHLCPDHPDAFDGHQPCTDADGDRVSVSCSCGRTFATVSSGFTVGHFPTQATERMWFNHLPAELRWYLWRGQRQWAVQDDHTGARMAQKKSEEAARKFIAEYGGRLFYRDAESDDWSRATADLEV